MQRHPEANIPQRPLTTYSVEKLAVLFADGYERSA